VRLPSVCRSTGFRTALLYAALFGTSVLILWGVVYWQTAGDMERQLHAVIDADLWSLSARVEQRGLAALRDAIHERLAAARSRTARYLLLDPQGAVVAGDLPVLARHPGWAALYAPRREDGTAARATRRTGHLVLGRGLPLADGAFLFVGQDAYQLEELRELLVAALGWGVGVTVVLAAVGGTVMGRRALRRVDAINRVAAAIVRGDWARRMPTRGTGDEFDLLAQHLNHMLARMHGLMEGMRQVTTDIAHDLRTPLGRLRQQLEGVRRDATTMTEYQQAVEQAIAETDQILATFAALLRIAQIEAGHRRARFIDVDVGAVLETILDAYTPVAEESRHALHGHLGGSVSVRGDRDLLVQLFANLVENALRHTPPGSRIDVTLTRTPGGPSATVADNGPGIPAPARQKVTQRFYRVEGSRSTPGSGLGLSLVAAIAELHGAALELHDNHPGLRVTLTFPAERQSPQGSAGVGGRR
jgi:signal transduction histidine kinase